MLSHHFSILLLSCLVGCSAFQEYNPLLAQPTDGSTIKCPPSPDFAVPAAPCAAAKGLPGNNLFCVDFSSISDQMLGNQPLPQQLTNWSFNNPPNCWEVQGGKLQVVNFSGFMSTCAFTMPMVSSADYGQYSSFILSLVQTVSISEAASQQVQVMLGANDPLNRLMTQWTGKQARQQSIVEIGKSDLPGDPGAYQPLFVFSATTTAGGGYSGWNIESIAVNAQ
jgi:hypothetical protein